MEELLTSLLVYVVVWATGIGSTYAASHIVRRERQEAAR